MATVSTGVNSKCCINLRIYLILQLYSTKEEDYMELISLRMSSGLLIHHWRLSVFQVGGGGAPEVASHPAV